MILMVVTTLMPMMVVMSVMSMVIINLLRMVSSLVSMVLDGVMSSDWLGAISAAWRRSCWKSVVLTVVRNRRKETIVTVMVIRMGILRMIALIIPITVIVGSIMVIVVSFMVPMMMVITVMVTVMSSMCFMVIMVSMRVMMPVSFVMVMFVSMMCLKFWKDVDFVM